MMKVTIQKKKDNPQGILEINIGGDKDTRVIIYRGKLQDIKSMMTQCYRAVMAVERDLEVTPENG